MALGIEPNSIAPQLIQNAGQSQVQLIRQVGQQISGHLTEMQTKRDLAGLAQSLQGANVQSNEFPLQLAQIASQHPMAVRDERGQMLMGILGKAHGAWQASEEDAKAFNRQMALQGFRARTAEEAARQAEENIRTRPIRSSRGGMKDPLTGEVLVEEFPPVPGAPKTLPPGSVLVDPSGKKLAENPKLPTSGGGQLTQRRLIINSQIDNLDKDLGFDIKEHQRLLKDEEAIKKELEETSDPDKKAALEYRRSVKALDAEKVLRKINETRAKKFQLAESLGELGQEIEPELGAVPPNATAPIVAPSEAGVLPPLGAISGPVPVKTRAEAERLPKGTQYQTPDGRIFTRN